MASEGGEDSAGVSVETNGGQPFLDALPAPLLADFYAGRWLPIVGAGFSRNAQLPDGEEMPTWNQLGELLGDDLQKYTPNGAIDAISAYAEEYGRSQLVEQLGVLLKKGVARPGEAHRQLARVGFDLIVSTNFDFLLEDAYAEAQRQCTPLLTEEQLPQRPRGGEVQLLKLHGDLNHPRQMVATEEDFDGFLTRRPLMATYLANLFITRTPVFVGYSFEDADTRSIWTVIKDRLDRLRRRGYALMVKPSPTEIARFQRRGINVVELPGTDYEEAFSALFKEMGREYTENVGDFAKATEDDVAAQLRLPVGARSRLCFCSVPDARLGWYRRELFPVINAAGYIPVTLADVAAPGATIAATENALLQRAQLVFLDGASPNATYELNRALERSEAVQIMVVLDAGQTIGSLRTPPTPTNLQVATRRDVASSEEPDPVVEAVRKWLAEHERDTSQPRQLFRAGHYNAALIVAVTGLEDALREHDPPRGRGRPPGLRTLVREAADRKVIGSDELALIEDGLGARNDVVHSRREELNPGFVESVLDSIEAVTGRLDEWGSRAPG